MLFHTCGNRQNIGVENNVERVHAHTTCQQRVCALRYRYAPLVCSGLPLFVEAHDHHGSSVPHHIAGMAEKHFFSFFQRDGIDDTLTLQTFQSCQNHLPVGGVDHDRHRGNIRFGGNDIKKGDHSRLCVDKRIIHVDIDDQRSVGHLLTSHRNGFVVFSFLNQSQKFP